MSERVRQLLKDLEGCLRNVLQIISGERLPYEKQAPELELRAPILVGTVKSLYKLSYSIRRPGAKVGSQRAALYRELIPESTVDFGDAFEPFDRSHVVNLLNDLRKKSFQDSVETSTTDQRPGHPDALVDPFTDLLTRAITKRRRQFRYWAGHRQKLAQITGRNNEEPKPNVVSGGPEPQPEGQPASEARNHASAAPPQSQGPRTETEATKYTPHPPAPSDGEDVASIAPSASTTRDLDGHEAEFPKPPETNGREFECPYCFVLCPAREATRSRWRKHILEDLQPYLCTYLECKLSDQLFSSRTTWRAHEETYHRQAWGCRDHRDAVFPTKESYLTHLHSLHPESTPDDMQMIMDLSVIAREDTRERCPLCLIRVEKLRKGQNLLKHVANHLERIACFALPRDVDLKDETDDKESLKLRSDQSEECGQWSRSDSSSTDGEMDSPTLYVACWVGFTHNVLALLQQRADADALGGEYGNALQAACVGGHKEVVQLLLDHGVGVNIQGGYHGNALQAASFEGHDEIAQLLIRFGADVNRQGGEYGNALQAASVKGHVGVVQMLLDHGADVNAPGGYYGTALQAASAFGHETVVRLLMKFGADVEAFSGKHGTALQAACAAGDESLVSLLLKSGASVNVQGGLYGSALTAAVVEGHDDVVQLLLDSGADVDIQCGIHGPPLLTACASGNEKLVKLLLDAGADVHARGLAHTDALRAAPSDGHKAIVRLLLDQGARLLPPPPETRIFELQEEMQQHALKRKEIHRGLHHPDTMTSLSNIAALMQEHGKYRMASDMYRQVLRRRVEVLGARHPDTLKIRDILRELPPQQQILREREEAELLDLQVRRQGGKRSSSQHATQSDSAFSNWQAR